MSQPTLAQLEAFYWTATLSSVDRAASILNVAQPTISLRLKTLSDALGYIPLQKHGRHLKLTLQGDALLEECKIIFACMERIGGQGYSNKVSGPIRIGFAEGFAMICLPDILKELHKNYPELQPELMVSTSAQIEPELHALKLDLAFIVNPTEHEHFKLIPLGAQETSWIAATSWNLPTIVRPKDLMSLPIISNPIGSLNYQQMIGWFASNGLTPTRVDFCSSVSILSELVNKGVGVGIYPNKVADNEVSGGRVKILQTDPPVANTPIFAKFHRQSRKAKLDAVLNTVTKILANLDYLR
ncbi:LysR family transcriptional regulator [Paenochrobactrum pullorum]|uniref:LysR family transcriptional regulator n=1 Tax=Paenochrobactrum pullorum TaxID=1324351 RepID=UPI0035BC758C